MRVYHFTSARWGIEDIRLKRLKIARLEETNDPFEMLTVAVTNQVDRRAFGSVRAHLDRRFGMICFSRDWRNPVQWSHYADKHRGVCLGFDVDDELLTPVIYRAKPYDESVLRDLANLPETDAAALMERVMTTKYSHWRYEKEVRMFADFREPDPQSGLHFAEFSPKMALAQVIVGHRCQLTRENLAEALGDLNGRIAVTRARLSFRSFQVVRQRNESLWR